MTASTKLLFAAAALCAVGIWWLGRGDDPRPAASVGGDASARHEASA
jgi:hypothetical protein